MTSFALSSEFNWANGKISGHVAEVTFPSTINLINMVAGGAYTLVIEDTDAGAVTFAHSGMTLKFSDGTAAYTKTAAKKLVVTFLVGGTSCAGSTNCVYMSAIEGF